MRHDAKLGLALGMLVIGFAVAFCFPRQPEPAVWSHSKTPAPIAEPELDFLPIKAYQTAAGAPARATEGLSTSRTSDGTPAATDNSSMVNAVSPSLAGPPAVQPLPLAQTLPDATATVPGNPTMTPESPRLPAAGNSAPVVEPKTYVIQPGDTLSGIAVRFLGAQSRFQEIYEANRDVLSSPNDLKIGMHLKIPSSPGASSEMTAQRLVPAQSDPGGSGTGSSPVWSNVPAASGLPAVAADPLSLSR
jgi:LysM repeat protein